MNKFLNIEVVTPATIAVLTLAEVKGHLRIELEDTSEDSLLTALIATATEYCEKAQSRVYALTTFKASLDLIPCIDEVIRFPFLPVQIIDSVKIRQVIDGVDQESVTVPAAQYELDKTNGRFKLNQAYDKGSASLSALPGFGAFEIVFKAGYNTEPAEIGGVTPDTAEIVPPTSKQAMLLLIGHWYEHREDATDSFEVKQVPTAAKALLQKGKVY